MQAQSLQVGPPLPVDLNAPRVIVLDTNVVLDVFIFSDVAAAPVRAGLADGSLHWIATAEMREELRRVLDYTHLVPRLTYYQLTAADVLAAFDRLAHMVPVAAKTHLTCKDPDDQKFIDLAVAHRSVLLSKDHAVLRLKKRLLPLGVCAAQALV